MKREPCGPASCMHTLCSCASAAQPSLGRDFSSSLHSHGWKYCIIAHHGIRKSTQDDAQSRALRAAGHHLKRGGFAAASYTDELQQQRVQQHAHRQSSASKRARALRLGRQPSWTHATGGRCAAAWAERTSRTTVTLARAWRRLCRRVGCQRQPSAVPRECPPSRRR